MTRVTKLQINPTLICWLVVLKVWEPRLWYQSVAPWSHGYGDTTATYIHRAIVPSCMYAKHQYNIGIRVWKYVIIYIPTQKYKYPVITDCDIMLQKYYITRKHKSRLYKVQKIRTHELKERILRAGQDGTKLWLIRLLLEEGLVLSWRVTSVQAAISEHANPELLGRNPASAKRNQVASISNSKCSRSSVM